MTPQELADALVQVAAVDGGVNIHIRDGVWCASSPYSTSCSGYGEELGTALLALIARRKWEDDIRRRGRDAFESLKLADAPAESGTQVAE
jgi:hypothetical protein